jgi:lipoprotein-anchoring transpeptidase ErfK/SrfK
VKRFLPLIILTLLLGGFLAAFYKPHTILAENTFFGNMNIGKMNPKEAVLQIRNILENPIYLNADLSSRAVTLDEIGIGYDLMQLSAAAKTQCLLEIRSSSRLCIGNKTEEFKNDVMTVDEAKLKAYLKDLEGDFDFITENTQISYEDYSFVAPGKNAEVKIDYDDFLSSLKTAVADVSKIKIRISIETEDSVNQQKTESAALIDKITAPLLIKYGRNPIYIQKADLLNFIDSYETAGTYKNYILEEKIEEYLESLGEKYGSDDVKVIMPDAVKAIQNALILKAANYEVNNAVILPLEGKPRTNGEKHDIYLEVIKSQQRLYRFENGELVKTYIISTGLTWETPSGEFSVLGKQKMTISYFGNWYMPDYLPIGVINGQYRFGFHSIPYHMDGYGNIYSRDPNTMGSPATGGCIQLKPEEATELFEWAEIGTPVYIYE